MFGKPNNLTQVVNEIYHRRIVEKNLSSISR